MFCKSCGKELPNDAKFCLNCGEATVSIMNSVDKSMPNCPKCHSYNILSNYIIIFISIQQKIIKTTFAFSKSGFKCIIKNALHFE